MWAFVSASLVTTLETTPDDLAIEAMQESDTRRASKN